MPSQPDSDQVALLAMVNGADANIDRRKCHRVVPLEVLSLGFSRTGTLSMQEAFSVLGYANPYHYSSILGNVRDADMWIEAYQAKYKHHNKDFDYRRHFDQLLGHCGAVTDTPAIAFWKELVEAYPDAKIVLVERDEDRWYASCEVLLEGVLNPFGRYVLLYTDPYWFGKVIRCGILGISCLFGTSDLNQAKKNARAAYRSHYAGIREFVPRERLLEYELGSGWAPLCKFLGKEIPDAQFPHLNEAKTLQLAFVDMSVRAIKRSLMNVSMVVAAGAVAGSLIRRFLGLA